MFCLAPRFRLAVDLLVAPFQELCPGEQKGKDPTHTHTHTHNYFLVYIYIYTCVCVRMYMYFIYIYFCICVFGRGKHEFIHVCHDQGMPRRYLSSLGNARP